MGKHGKGRKRKDAGRSITDHVKLQSMVNGTALALAAPEHRVATLQGVYIVSL